MSDGLTDAFRWIKPHNFKVSIIAAVGNNNELGDDNGMLWYLPTDLKRFKDLTIGNTVIMGRKTHDIIGDLPGRTNYIVSKNIRGKNIFNRLDQSISSVNTEQCFLIGGQKIYEIGMEYVDKIYLTKIDKTFENATVFFPDINMDEWKIEWESEKIEENNLSFKFINFIRK
jgi:dihydrofolate reductase